jgi:hypothetical protein
MSVGFLTLLKGFDIIEDIGHRKNARAQPTRADCENSPVAGATVASNQALSSFVIGRTSASDLREFDLSPLRPLADIRSELRLIAKRAATDVADNRSSARSCMA